MNPIPRPSFALVPAAALHLCLSLAATAADWPQFLGPTRDGTSPERVSKEWSDGGPKVIASRPVGAGFAGPVVANDRVVLHHRQGNDSIIECLDAANARTRWRHAYPSNYRDRFGFDEGPRATPTLAAGRVIAFGAEGILTCLDLDTGRALWTVDTVRTLEADPGFFGFACSPLVLDDKVLLAVGGRNGAGIVAFDFDTGAVRWKAVDDEAGYASPIRASAGSPGEARAVFFTREGLVILHPDSGAVTGRFAWRSRQNASVNAATPLVIGDRLFLTASYDTGAAWLDWNRPSPRVLWSGDDSLSSHYASVVHHEGHLYGFHGRQEFRPALRCIEAETGKVRWSQDGLGCGSLLLARDQLLILMEHGELLRVPATPSGFRPAARAQVLGSGCRAYPALAHGRLWARDTKKLVCLELGTGD